MYLANYLCNLRNAAEILAASYRSIAAARERDADVHYTCLGFARQCDKHGPALAVPVERYAGVIEPGGQPEVTPVCSSGVLGPIGLLGDLQALYQLLEVIEVNWALVGQAARGARDSDLIDVVTTCHGDITEQSAWLRMRMKTEAAQALLITPNSVAGT